MYITNSSVENVEIFPYPSISCWRDRRYMAEILPIRRKTLSNQSINQYVGGGEGFSKITMHISSLYLNLLILLIYF